MQPIGLGNTKILTYYAQKSSRTLVLYKVILIEPHKETMFHKDLRFIALGFKMRYINVVKPKPVDGGFRAQGLEHPNKLRKS